MKKYFKLICFILVLSVPFFIGCRPRFTGPAPFVYIPDPNLNPPGTLPIARERVPIRIGIESVANVENFATNWMTRQLEELGNFDITFEVYPAGQLSQTIALMVMAGGRDLPCVVIGNIDIGTATRYGQAGMFLPLNAFYENSAYWSLKAAQDLDIDPFRYVTSYDGNIYGLWGINVSLNNTFNNGRLMSLNVIAMKR